ncbi:hypothetical protein ACHAW6_011924 [Cyclotella cf. meneghiniana]
MYFNAEASCKHDANGDDYLASNTRRTFITLANAAVDDSQWSSQMIPSLDNLANTAVQKMTEWTDW